MENFIQIMLKNMGKYDKKEYNNCNEAINNTITF